ncbi:MAG: hypothetical protein IPN60_08700 [Saprospiraceae bacterium]|nr:hypothetical protein [Candidatus Opimibacter skivensis]
MKTIYLIVGSIGSGKSSFGKDFFANKNIEYISTDCYKKLFFDYYGHDLLKGYHKGDLLVQYKLEKNCKNNSDLIYEICPTNIDKINFIKYLLKTYNYKIVSFIIGTDDVNININRGKARYNLEGGDPVSEEKVTSRYYTTMTNLSIILNISNKTYFIDNSIKIKKIAYFENNTMHIFAHNIWFDEFVVNKINKI